LEPTYSPVLEPTPLITVSPIPIPNSVEVTDEGSSASASVVAIQNMEVVVPPPVVVKEEVRAEPGPVAFMKTDDREVVRPGEVVTYRLVVSNPFEYDLTEVTVTDHLSPYIEALGANPEADLDPNGRVITWHGQTISAQSEVTFAVRARVLSHAPHGLVIRNIADVNGPGVRLHAEDVSLVEGEIIARAEAPVIYSTPITAPTGGALALVTLALGAIGGGARGLSQVRKGFIRRR